MPSPTETMIPTDQDAQVARELGTALASLVLAQTPRSCHRGQSE